MTVVAFSGWADSDQEAVREQLDRILKSGQFLQSRRRQRFLQYIVNETLAGRGERLKGYNVAREVFDRPETFDANVDPVVRMEAARLRDRLREYYETDGQNDTIRIELPKGSYTPHIEFRHAEALEPKPDRSDAAAQDECLRSASRRRWQIILPAFALILALGAVGAWFTRSIWMPAPKGATKAAELDTSKSLRSRSSPSTI